eukprot:COSAG01_NODE_325_length_18790_cov_64.371101_3_plen_163_part_00
MASVREGGRPEQGGMTCRSRSRSVDSRPLAGHVGSSSSSRGSSRGSSSCRARGGLPPRPSGARPRPMPWRGPSRRSAPGGPPPSPPAAACAHAPPRHAHPHRAVAHVAPSPVAQPPRSDTQRTVPPRDRRNARQGAGSAFLLSQRTWWWRGGGRAHRRRARS